MSGYNPFRSDHVETAAQAMLHPGKWVSAGRYLSESGAATAARKARSGDITAYAPAGLFEAKVRHDGNVIELWVRFNEEAARGRLRPDGRPVAQVARPRIESSDDPEWFELVMVSSQQECCDGQDLATARLDLSDPIRLAAEIEALAGCRRLAAAKAVA
ncbi:hypothetical protein ACH4Q7_22365 [Streptomyces roseolus]|uniref:hypothetical protein n=1 Tax=Streptomyces roseolus TaxID=67358 RepID=UPI0037B83D2D